MKKLFILFVIINSLLFCGEKKLGLVLSGGGAKGFAHVGVLKVLEEEKIPVEYISGTSMGSIIGALYSMGYSADEIEKIVLNYDWFEYFNDEIPRKDTAIEEKIYKDRYPLSFPVKDWTIKLPKGVIKGQKIENFLSMLYFDGIEIKDFSKFPIQFSCVATDIETGEAVVLKKGDIDKAVRASMSIPTVFSPVEINGKLLVDGMMSKNFPVQEVLDMGAETVIGCDVGGRLKKKDKINSFLEIIDQSINYRIVESTDKEREKAEILIIPELEKYTTMDFGKAAEIISEGEKAAREKIAELRKYRDVGKFEDIKSRRVHKLDAVYIDNIKINGNSRYNGKIIKQVMGQKLPVVYTAKEINKKIEKLYSLGFFDKINYSIQNSTLEINVEEAAEKEIKLGFNYNSYTRGELFLNGIIKGFGNSGSKTSLNLVLGKDETVNIQHIQYSGVVNKIGIMSSIEFSNIEDYAFYFNEKKINEYDIDMATVNIMAGSLISDRTIAGIGLERAVLTAKAEIESEDIKDKIYKNYGTIYAKYFYDSRDRVYFPKSGTKLNGEIGYSEEKIGNAEFTRYDIEFEKAIPINSKLTINTGVSGKIIYGDDIPENILPALGGVYNRQNSINFYGLEPSRYFSNKIASIFAESLYQFSKERYFIFRYNSAYCEDVNNGKLLHGIGTGVGAMTAIGPIELLFTKSNKDEENLFVNIGFKF